MIKETSTERFDVLGRIPAEVREDMANELYRCNILPMRDTYVEVYGTPEYGEAAMNIALKAYQRLFDPAVHAQRILVSDGILMDVHGIADGIFSEGGDRVAQSMEKKWKPHWLMAIPNGKYIIAGRDNTPWIVLVEEYQVHVAQVYYSEVHADGTPDWSTPGMDYFMINTTNKTDAIELQEQMTMLEYIAQDLGAARRAGASEEHISELLFSRTLLVGLLFYLWSTKPEQVTVMPRGSRVIGVTRYVNPTSSEITIMNRSRNKEYHHVLGCLVNGHMRLQPYGPRDNPEYKLIYIKPYAKKPYVRRGNNKLR